MWRLLSRKDIAGAVLVAVVLAGLVAGYLVWPGHAGLTGNKASLGPDWECTYPGKGDPVCVKKVKPD
jgi:hypothetical protein